MATVTNKRKVFFVEGKVKAIREIENRKNEADVLREFGLLNSATKRSGKIKPKFLALLSVTDREAISKS